MKTAISQYNDFEIFYGYTWNSDFISKEMLRNLMANVREECISILEKQYNQQIFMRISDLEMKEGRYLPLQLRKQLHGASIGIFDISDPNPNVYYELGHMHGAGKSIIVLKEQSAKAVADLEGIYEIRYDGKNIPAIKDAIVRAVCKIVDQKRQKIPWDTFLWEHMQNSKIKVYLGWTASEFRNKNRKTPVGLSVGDVEVLNKLRQHFPNLNHQRIDLETDYADFSGKDLSDNIISIGGPRRNPCTSAILNLPEVTNRINYEFDRSAPDKDGFIEYYIRNRKDKTEFRTNLRLQQSSKPEHQNGVDYGIIYKLTFSAGDPLYTWIILSGLTRQGTLACLDCLYSNKSVQSNIIQHSLDALDTEILIEARIIRGKHMNNPVVKSIKGFSRIGNIV
jgi:hypothetical protein